MALTTTTVFMGLVLPVVGQQVGPTWGQNLDDAFTAVDSHDHSTGKGTPVTPAGLNLVSDVSFKGNGASGNNATNLRSIRLESQAGTLVTSTDRRCVYAFGNELYYTDGVGAAVRLTLAGAVDTSGSGNITGMGGTTAGVSYSNITKVFTFIQAANQAASIDAGNISVREPVAAGNATTLKAATGLAGSYNLTFPAALPAGSELLWSTSTGQLGLGGAPVSTARVTFSGGLNLGTTADTTPGNLRHNGTFFQGFEGGAFKNIIGLDYLGSVAPLAANATTFGAVTIAARDQVKILVSILHGAVGTGNILIRFNGDAGANYGWRLLTCATGGVVWVDTNGTGDSSCRLAVTGTGAGLCLEITINNRATTQKTLAVAHGEDGGGANPAAVVVNQAKWNNTAAQITSVEVFSSLANGLGIGSCISFFGRNT